MARKPILSVPHSARTTTTIDGDLKGHRAVPKGSGTLTPDEGYQARAFPLEHDVDWWYKSGDITSDVGALWEGDNGAKHWQLSDFGHEQGIYPSQHVTGYSFEVVSNSQKNRKILLHRIGLILTKPNNNDIWWGGHFMGLDSDLIGTHTISHPNAFTTGTNNNRETYFGPTLDGKKVYDYLTNGWVISKLRLFLSTDNGTSGTGVLSQCHVRKFRWAYNTIDGKNLILPKLRPYDSRFDQKRIG